jgi:hypothetical protein
MNRVYEEDLEMSGYALWNEPSSFHMGYDGFNSKPVELKEIMSNAVVYATAVQNQKTGEVYYQVD